MADRLLVRLPRGYRRLMVVGDVHGHRLLFERLVAHAQEQRAWILAIGDIIDRGPDSAGCLRLMRELEEAGRGTTIRGNHEDKLYRTLIGNKTKVADDLQRTLDELEEADDGEALRRWFRDRFPEMPFVARFGDTIIAHGGFHPVMLETGPELPDVARRRALFGRPAEEKTEDGKPIRLYDYVTGIPRHVTVLIGHDPICDRTLLTRQAPGGGLLVHTDSASSRGGPLSAVFLDGDGRIECALQIRHEDDAVHEVAFEPIAVEARL